VFKKNLNIQNLQTLAASALPFAALFIAKIISPIWEAAVAYAPGKNANLTLPSGPQSTAYLVSYPQQRR
jgi:hypothetical protein